MNGERWISTCLYGGRCSINEQQLWTLGQAVQREGAIGTGSRHNVADPHRHAL